jgi:long-chain acyl-CoA synthetase
MHIDFFIDLFQRHQKRTSIIWKDTKTKYYSLLENIRKFQNLLLTHDIKPGTVVGLEGDFSPNSIALLFALIEHACIIVPLTSVSKKNYNSLFDIAQVEILYSVDEYDNIEMKKIAPRLGNSYYGIIRARNNPGLVLFTSGTSGKPKAAVHDFSILLKKFEADRNVMRTLNFLLFDHWGGLNTMFYVLSNGGVVIATQNRSADMVCQLIEKHKIELLPASPTFLNMIILSESYREYDLDSLKMISYGTEPMPENTLKRLKIIFPKVKLLQTYGLIELGVLRSQSESDSSLWVKVGGDGYKTRVVDGILQIKADSAMLGYLNAPSPFTEDGYFITGDKVLQKGEYIRILGRESEIINVGGEKVYPQEVENIIMDYLHVSDVTVFGEKNPIIGNIVCAKVVLVEDVDTKKFIADLKHYCGQRMKKFMIPVKVSIVKGSLYGDRFKKNR